MNRSLLLRYRRLRRFVAAVLLLAAAAGAPAAAPPVDRTPGAGTELAAHSDAAGLPTAAILVSHSAGVAAAALEARGGAPPFSRAKQSADPGGPSDVLRASVCAGVLRPVDPAPGHRHALHFLHAAPDGRYTSTSPPIPG